MAGSFARMSAFFTASIDSSWAERERRVISLIEPLIKALSTQIFLIAKRMPSLSSPKIEGHPRVDRGTSRSAI